MGGGLAPLSRSGQGHSSKWRPFFADGPARRVQLPGGPAFRVLRARGDMKPKSLSAMVLLAVFLSSSGLWRCGPRRPDPPVAAVEAHSEALVLWLERGIRGATLVHVDAHNDLREIPPEKVAAIEALAGRGDLHAMRRADSPGEDGLYHEGSFVTAALHLGIVRNIVWVIPARDSESARADLSRLEK